MISNWPEFLNINRECTDIFNIIHVNNCCILNASPQNSYLEILTFKGWSYVVELWRGDLVIRVDTCIPVSQDTGWVVWYSHLLKNFPHFI